MPDAFSAIRSVVGTPREPRLQSKKFDDELIQMDSSDGLMLIPEHSPSEFKGNSISPDISPEMISNAHLWVVREDDAVHAAEYSDFGKTLGNGCIKHTNLTGGRPAFCGGELLWFENLQILLNGCSGRYGPLNASEMHAAALAFVKAGYRVWSTGYDEGSGFCFKFGASMPMEVVSP